MIDNGQEMEMDTDFRDCENNQILNHNNSNRNLQRNRKKKKRAADIPVKKFNGEFIYFLVSNTSGTAFWVLFLF